MVRVGIPLALAALALSLGLGIHRLETLAASPYPIVATLRFDEDLIRSPFWVARADDRVGVVDLPVEFSFRPGETLGQVLDGFGLEPVESHALVTELANHVDVRRLHPEDRYAALVDREDRFQGFRLTIAGKGEVEAKRAGDGWQSSWRPFIEVSETRVVTGSLDGFLESSIQNAGGEAVLAYVMADVLQWDLDFNRDLRLGDRFEILYERIYLEGEFHRVGGILALIYENDDRRLEAYRFGADGGHYDGEGRPLRKLFLRSPLRYSRVTSGFSSRRFHPVLKQYRPHYGIDYGAPAGTPVRVTGSGVVQSAGWDSGGGKTIKVRHPNGYLTAYLHLSRFADGVRSGKRVSQGEVIGYVGSTGLATAPHLDYRMQRNGHWMNPLTLKSKPAEPIPAEQLPEFESWRDLLRAALQSGDSIDLPPASASGQVADLEVTDPLVGDSVGR